MVAMWVVEVTIDEVIELIAVRHRGVTTVRPMLVGFVVLTPAAKPVKSFNC
jgi:hypothetical protein